VLTRALRQVALVLCLQRGERDRDGALHLGPTFTKAENVKCATVRKCDDLCICAPDQAKIKASTTRSKRFRFGSKSRGVTLQLKNERK
jgi:hypothetical protein